MENATHLRDRLAAAVPAYGAWVLSASPRVAEALSNTALDWIGIDMEHSPVRGPGVEALIRAVERGSATPLVRIPSIEAGEAGVCKMVLDSGAGGIIVPGVRSGDDVDRIASAMSFPPAGTRGAAGTTRANGYGVRFSQYIDRANDECLLIVQIENRAGLAAVDEIVGHDAVDVAFIGENDLSTAMGHPGDIEREEVTSAVDAVHAAARDADVVSGIAGRSPERLQTRIDRGFRFFLLGADISLMRGALADFIPEPNE